MAITIVRAGLGCEKDTLRLRCAGSPKNAIRFFTGQLSFDDGNAQGDLPVERSR
jgi:hypothetical protein